MTARSKSPASHPRSQRLTVDLFNMNSPAPLLKFPQLLFPRLRRALIRLAQSVWTDPVPVQVRRTSARLGDFTFDDAQRAPLQEISLPTNWQAPGFSTSWFHLKIPKGFTLRPNDHLHWDDNAEATAWLSGKPLYGFDATHRYWPWPKQSRELWLESIFCQSGIWHAAAKGIGPTGSLLQHARLVRKNEASWQAYFDLEVLTDWLEEEIRRTLPGEAEQLIAGFRSWPEMDSASATFLPDGVGTGIANRWRPTLDRLPPLLRICMSELDAALNVYHLNGAAALSEGLKPIYHRLKEIDTFNRVLLTGHAHIDLVWLWPESTGEQKAVHTFANARALLEKYPDFYFGYSQPASYEAVKRRAPKLMAAVTKQIEGGRWEATGAMYVESDTLLPCGEALLRSALIGQEKFAQLQGASSPVLWLPDAFGFCGCLPRIMDIAHVKYFYTNKLAWRMINRFPHTSFIWRGTDGTEVLAHVSRAVGYNNPARPRNLRLESEANAQADLHDEFLLPSGWGDGGGGPTADIIERVQRQSQLRNQPAARWGRIDDFFGRLENARDQLPVWRGEIGLEAHRGTFTTQALMKEAYREFERALQTYEAAHCIAGLGSIPKNFWERLVFAQFHDCLPGSSIHEVYEEIIPEMKRLTAEAVARAEALLGGKGKPESSFRLFNPLPIAITTWASDQPITIPPLSAAAVSEKIESSNDSPALIAKGRTLSNGYVNASFSEKGEISLTIGEAAPTSLPPYLIAYRDVPYDLEAWEIDRQALDTGIRLQPKKGGTITRGPGWVGYVQTFSFGASTIESLWRLRAGGVALEIEFNVDWRSSETLLRFELATPFRGQTALCGAPFGGEWRLQQPGDAQHSAQWEMPASRWLLASDDGREEGTFLVAAAKYGFSVRDGLLGVSLIKSAKVTNTTAFPASFRSGPGREPWSDFGRHTIQLAIGRLTKDSAREHYPAALAETLFAEPIKLGSEANSRAPIMPSLGGMPSLAPNWAIPVSARRWLLRLHETMGRRGVVHIEAPSGWQWAVLKSADLESLGSIPIKAGKLEVTPFAIVTLSLTKN